MTQGDYMSRADLILKLTVGKDKRTVEPVETGGRISNFFKLFNANIKNVFWTNLIYTGIFALPLIFSLFILPNLVHSYVYSGRHFIGNFGFGFPGVADSYSEAVLYQQYVNRIFLFPCIIGSVFIAFVGLSGVFHCSRGYMWCEKVNIKSFFRGIKKMWKPFMLIGAIFCVVLAGCLYGFEWHNTLLKLSEAYWASYLVAAVVGIVGALVALIVMIMLPSIACYDFKLRDHFKNAVLLNIVMFVPSLIILGVTVGLCMLSTVSLFSFLIPVLLALLGFFFVGMMWTSYSQYLFDNFICTQVDANGNRLEVTIKKKTAKEVKEYVGAKKKNATDEEEKTRAEKKKEKHQQNKNSYNSAYKRKGGKK